MKLYHGTNGDWLPNILRCGLEPRGKRATRNNWKHVSHQSNPKAVYFSNSYAPYFAFNAARGKNPTCAVIEIDTEKLPRVPSGAGLVFDEDCWEQLGRGRDGVPGDMSARTLWWRDKQDHPLYQTAFRNADGTTGWQLSLKALGTCAYLGTVPATAITRAVSWPCKGNSWLRFVWDPSIVLANQQICGPRYKALTAKLFGDSVEQTLDEFDARAVDSFKPERIAGLQIIIRQEGDR